MNRYRVKCRVSTQHPWRVEAYGDLPECRRAFNTLTKQVLLGELSDLRLLATTGRIIARTGEKKRAGRKFLRVVQLLPEEVLHLGDGPGPAPVPGMSGSGEAGYFCDSKVQQTNERG